MVHNVLKWVCSEEKPKNRVFQGIGVIGDIGEVSEGFWGCFDVFRGLGCAQLSKIADFLENFSKNFRVAALKTHAL